jgi:hypothetical protein
MLILPTIGAYIPARELAPLYVPASQLPGSAVSNWIEAPLA